MEKQCFLPLKEKTVSLIGYGVSNKAVFDYLVKNGIYPIIRNKEKIPLPSGASGVFGSGYLDIGEEVVFRSPGVRLDSALNGIEVYTEASYALKNTRAHKIGITGSDGKTTTSSLIYEILKNQGKSAYLCGNIGTPIISYIDKAREDSFLVCELSSFQLFDSAPPLDCAVVTSISENHLDWHKSLTEYIYSKRNILKKARRAVVHYDMEYRELFTHENITYFSLNNCEKLIGEGRGFVYIKDSYAYYNKKRLFPTNIVKLKGKHNLLNVLAAVGATYPYVEIEKIIDTVSHFCGVEHRSTEVEKLNGVTFIDSSVDSTPARTITTLGLFPREKSILILGGQDKGLSYAPLKNALTGVKLSVIFGINKEKIQKAINGACRFVLVNNIFEATNLAYKEACEGDYIILSPASTSFDMFENYIDRAEKFKEAIRGIKDAKDKGNSKYPNK